jgi:hypothetical protein
MQLLEIIDYGPNTFGTDEESGGNSVEDAKKRFSEKVLCF